MCSLPVIDVTSPAALNGQVNGKLSSSILADTPGLVGGPRIRLLATTSTRAWRALAGTGQRDGVILKATSLADSYRTYEQQVATFTSRYQLEPIAGRPFRLWDSDNSGIPEKWYQLPNTAVAAVPGHSNHGWGLAVDVADASGVRLDWMLANAVRFGWSWETQLEPWHIRYVTGDTIPVAVLAYEITKGEDMGAFILSGFTGQPDSTQGRYHVADASPQGYHVANLEPVWNQLCWPNAPRMSPGSPVPLKYTYAMALEVLFGKPQPADAGTVADHVHASGGPTGGVILQ